MALRDDPERKRLKAHHKIAAARERAIRSAFLALYRHGVIETSPEQIPRRMPEGGLPSYLAALPSGLRKLIEDGRLVLIVQTGAEAPHGVLEQGWVCLDPPTRLAQPEPECALDGWVVHDNELDA
jgi:hypothetical protein